MTRHKMPTIAEQGGLKVYLTKHGVDYILFRLLSDLSGQTNTSIARALSERAGRKIWPRTVAHWRTIDEAESEQRHA